ncbi:MBL fold metallo-hydrolase [Nocardia sp. NPDC051463]|uniref:MBL fold metallo-hydrolase n=1 Tax=Nocardia sp. NPDC051463 TaxID=3154845 RepID=UPI003432374D
MTESTDWTDAELGRAKPLPTLLACCGALAATPARMFRPRRPDKGVLASISDAGLPFARASVRLTALTQTGQTAPTALIAEGVRDPRHLRLGMTTFLVEHPKARFLVDPAVCADVHERVLPQLAKPLQRFVAPEKPVIGLADMLGRVDVDVADIDFALPTHLHWDHVSGLLELPASIPVSTNAVEHDWALAGPVAPLGVARGPLLGRTFQLYELDGPPVSTFTRSHDVFGDGSVVLVDLPGHTPGSVGVLLAVDDGSRVLLAGDSIWHGLQATLLRGTAPFLGRIIDHDHEGAAFDTIHRLHVLTNEVTVVASHDHGAASRLPRWYSGVSADSNNEPPAGPQR